MGGSVTAAPSAGVLYANAFIVGAVLMGFEMLGSRYLFPYFGGGIGTWAALISTVLVALALGYFVGGTLVDRHPSGRLISGAVAVAALCLALVPLAADPLMTGILERLGDGPAAVLLAAAALLLAPMALLGTLSPVAVRLLVREAGESGRVSGRIYGVSTIGNVFGTLFTTFVLIPAIGSRSITYLYAVVLGLAAATLWLASGRRR